MASPGPLHARAARHSPKPFDESRAAKPLQRRKRDASAAQPPRLVPALAKKGGSTEESALRPRRRSPVLTELRRGEIVAAAVKLFSRHGFENTRAEDIALSAGVAKGTLYLYFPSKEAIYSAAIGHAVQEVQALVSERIGAAATFTEKLTAAIEVRLHFWAGHEVLYRLLLTLGRQPNHRRQTNQLLRSAQQGLLAIYDEAIAAGELPSGDYGAHAWAVLDMVRGATERRLDQLDRLHATSVQGDAEAITALALSAVPLPRKKHRKRKAGRKH